MEEKVINRFYHEHPLILSRKMSLDNLKKKNRWDDLKKNCYVCNNPISDIDWAYVCSIYCYNFTIVHKKCGDLASNIINHPRHPHHNMSLVDFRRLGVRDTCDVCRRSLGGMLGYRCNECEFKVDAACEKIGAEAVLEGGRKELHHPSHPDHPLTLMRKPPFSFRCDGCGDEGVDMAYICGTCEFWLHKGCATSLPLVRECHRRHHHRLSLAWSFPERHRKYDYTCEVCDGHFDLTCWLYFCDDCRYFVHVRCVDSVETPDLSSTSEDGAVEFPLRASHIFDNLIEPYVKEAAPWVVPRSTTLVSRYHEHPLSLVSGSTHEYEDEDEDGDGDGHGESKMICDACVTPISNSTPYYKCAGGDDACTYSIHSICSSLPSSLPSSFSFPCGLTILSTTPYYHQFKLFATSKSEGRSSFFRCFLCRCHTNGLGYECAGCGKAMDVKCTFLPAKIRHASTHMCRHRKPLILTTTLNYYGSLPSRRGNMIKKSCHVCGSSDSNEAYCCGEAGCDFALDLKCAMLPSSVTEREFDNHPLLLTFDDAARDHPSDFFCEFCEEEMHPKKWMYHCRECDASFHLDCLKNASGEYRNIKFGRRYEFEGIHPNHPLAFSYITLKKRCDLCRCNVYTLPGFECALCYYVVCLDCGNSELKKNKK